MARRSSYILLNQGGNYFTLYLPPLAHTYILMYDLDVNMRRVPGGGTLPDWLLFLGFPIK
jgi:hypothetical protein